MRLKSPRDIILNLESTNKTYITNPTLVYNTINFINLGTCFFCNNFKEKKKDNTYTKWIVIKNVLSIDEFIIQYYLHFHQPQPEKPQLLKCFPQNNDSLVKTLSKSQGSYTQFYLQ